METTIDGKPAYKYGESGKPYTYTEGDEQSRKNAKRKAYLQGVAIGGGKLEKSDLPIMEEQSSKKYNKEEAIAWLTEHNLIADIFIDSPWNYQFYQVPVENMYNMETPNFSDYEDGICIRYNIVNDNINVLCVDFDKKIEQVIVKMKQEDMIKDDNNNLLFGWGYVSKDLDGNQIYDHSGEFIKDEDFEDLELATYAYALAFREADTQHDCIAKGYLVEDMVFTKEKIEVMKKSGHLKGEISRGVWLGFYFPNDDDYNQIKKMSHPMFSLYGKATKEVVEE